MRNKYAGTCYRCGETVAVGDGHYEMVKTSPAHVKWRTQHASCAIKYRGTAHTYEAAKIAAIITKEPTP